MNNPDQPCDCYEQGLQFICCAEMEEPSDEQPSFRQRNRITGEMLS